jgi:uncharacterized protein YbjT (DUF2867 family)
MLLVTTPTGNTGQHVVQSLLAQGDQLRLLVRDPKRLDLSVHAQCEVITGDLRHLDALAIALKGIEGAFFCVPQSTAPEDTNAYYQSFATPFAHACQNAGVKRIVAISGGDGREGNRGVGQALHKSEQAIAATGIAVRYVRCGYFMENFFWMMQPIVHAGLFSLPIKGDIAIPFVAARDIGQSAARLLADRSWVGQLGVAAHGPEKLTCDAAASILTDILGRMVRFQQISGEVYKSMLAKHGCSDALGQSLVEMFESISLGRDMGDNSTQPVECPTTLAQWAGTSLKPAITSMHF